MEMIEYKEYVIPQSYVVVKKLSMEEISRIGINPFLVVFRCGRCRLKMHYGPECTLCKTKYHFFCAAANVTCCGRTIFIRKPPSTHLQCGRCNTPVRFGPQCSECESMYHSRCLSAFDKCCRVSMFHFVSRSCSSCKETVEIGPTCPLCRRIYHVKCIVGVFNCCNVKFVESQTLDFICKKCKNRVVTYGPRCSICGGMIHQKCLGINEMCCGHRLSRDIYYIPDFKFDAAGRYQFGLNRKRLSIVQSPQKDGEASATDIDANRRDYNWTKSADLVEHDTSSTMFARPNITPRSTTKNRRKRVVGQSPKGVRRCLQQDMASLENNELVTLSKVQYSTEKLINFKNPKPRKPLKKGNRQFVKNCFVNGATQQSSISPPLLVSSVDSDLKEWVGDKENGLSALTQYNKNQEKATCLRDNTDCSLSDVSTLTFITSIKTEPEDEENFTYDTRDEMDELPLLDECPTITREEKSLSIDLQFPRDPTYIRENEHETQPPELEHMDLEEMSSKADSKKFNEDVLVKSGQIRFSSRGRKITLRTPPVCRTKRAITKKENPFKEKLNFSNWPSNKIPKKWARKSKRREHVVSERSEDGQELRQDPEFETEPPVLQIEESAFNAFQDNVMNTQRIETPPPVLEVQEPTAAELKNIRLMGQYSALDHIQITDTISQAWYPKIRESYLVLNPESGRAGNKGNADGPLNRTEHSPSTANNWIKPVPSPQMKKEALVASKSGKRLSCTPDSDYSSESERLLANETTQSQCSDTNIAQTQKSERLLPNEATQNQYSDINVAQAQECERLLPSETTQKQCSDISIAQTQESNSIKESQLQSNKDTPTPHPKATKKSLKIIDNIVIIPKVLHEIEKNMVHVCSYQDENSNDQSNDITIDSESDIDIEDSAGQNCAQELMENYLKRKLDARDVISDFGKRPHLESESASIEEKSPTKTTGEPSTSPRNRAQKSGFRVDSLLQKFLTNIATDKDAKLSSKLNKMLHKLNRTMETSCGKKLNVGGFSEHCRQLSATESKLPDIDASLEKEDDAVPECSRTENTDTQSDSLESFFYFLYSVVREFPKNVQTRVKAELFQIVTDTELQLHS